MCSGKKKNQTTKLSGVSSGNERSQPAVPSVVSVSMCLSMPASCTSEILIFKDTCILFKFNSQIQPLYGMKLKITDEFCLYQEEMFEQLKTIATVADHVIFLKKKKKAAEECTRINHFISFYDIKL